MIDSSDVLPLPLGPMSASSSPGRQHPVMLCRICGAIGKVKQHLGSVERSVAGHLCDTSTAMQEQQTQKLSITANLQTSTRSQFGNFAVHLCDCRFVTYISGSPKTLAWNTEEETPGGNASRDVYVYGHAGIRAVNGLTACSPTLRAYVCQT
jgi:hypothetical protein